MRSTNHHKYPTRSHRNDYDFVSFGDSSASVLLTRNAARFDGELSAAGQIAPAESILSGRAIAASRNGCLHDNPGLAASPYPLANDCDLAGEPVSFYRSTLFDSVMDFLDRYDRMAAQQRSRQCAGRGET